MENRLISLFRQTRLFATDVDGVLTDGKISFTSDGQELKSFHIQDGLGLKLLQRGGILVAFITGRRSPMVGRRAKELGVDHLIEGREDKISALQELAHNLEIPLEQCVYVGDDLPDLAAIIAAGVGCTVADAHPLVKMRADLVAGKRGGEAAVREIAELILEARGQLEQILQDYEN